MYVMTLNNCFHWHLLLCSDLNHFIISLTHMSFYFYTFNEAYFTYHKITHFRCIIQSFNQQLYGINFRTNFHALIRSLMVTDGPQVISRLPRWSSDKESACQCRKHGIYPWVGKIPYRNKWQPTPVVLPWKSNGQKSLAGYSP